MSDKTPEKACDQKWISTKERLPEKPCAVFITIQNETGEGPKRYTTYGWYFKTTDEWVTDDYTIPPYPNVVAWMPIPLPEPYVEVLDELFGPKDEDQ